MYLVKDKILRIYRQYITMGSMPAIKIAIIEDDLSILEMYRIKLEIVGYEVLVATDGVSGLELVLREQPALILLDLKMPLMNGDEMLRQLRATTTGSNLKVFILTNISKDEAPRSLRVLHVDRYIVKAHHTPKQIAEMIAETLA